MKFKLEIEIGNDAMQEQLDVAEALQRVARELRYAGGFDTVPRTIFDTNGNGVGSYQITKES